MADSNQLSLATASILRQPPRALCVITAANIIAGVLVNTKERAGNNLNISDAGLLFLTKPSQEAHSWSTQRLRWFRQEQKDKPEGSSYFMHVPKYMSQLCLI